MVTAKNLRYPWNKLMVKGITSTPAHPSHTIVSGHEISRLGARSH
jgi:hypothetical protein